MSDARNTATEIKVGDEVVMAATGEIVKVKEINTDTVVVEQEFRKIDGPWQTRTRTVGADDISAL